MIVTFDASILVRATKRSNGPARKAMSALALNPAHVIALSPFILGEVGRVLSYPRMQALFRLTAGDIHEHVEFLRSVARIVEPSIGLPVVLADPSDEETLSDFKGIERAFILNAGVTSNQSSQPFSRIPNSGARSSMRVLRTFACGSATAALLLIFSLVFRLPLKTSRG